MGFSERGENHLTSVCVSCCVCVCWTSFPLEHFFVVVDSAFYMFWGICGINEHQSTIQNKLKGLPSAVSSQLRLFPLSLLVFPDSPTQPHFATRRTPTIGNQLRLSACKPLVCEWRKRETIPPFPGQFALMALKAFNPSLRHTSADYQLASRCWAKAESFAICGHFASSSQGRCVKGWPLFRFF